MLTGKLIIDSQIIMFRELIHNRIPVKIRHPVKKVMYSERQIIEMCSP